MKLSGSLRNDDRHGDGKVKTAILVLAKQQASACITLFNTFPCRYCTTTLKKRPNLTFYEGTKQARTKFSLSF